MASAPKISVVVPVYNAEKYLAKCLDSIIYQIYANLEIICVNDGSTDGSAKILADYAAKDERIKVFTQKNSGPAVARNLGIKQSSGEYVAFVDADDWILLDLYQRFVGTLRRTGDAVDIFMFNVASYFEGKNDVCPLKFVNLQDWVNHKSSLTIHKFSDCRAPFSRNLSAVNKIYRRSFLNENQIYFPEDRKYEDQYFYIKAGLHSKSVIITDAVFYRYRNYKTGSETTNVSAKTFDIFDIVQLVSDEVVKCGVFEQYKYALFQYKYNAFFSHYWQCPEDLRNEYFNKMKEVLLKDFDDSLDKNLCRRLRNYSMFEMIKNKDFAEFDKIYQQHWEEKR